MGERKGQNKYYPPDFDYKKHKSLAGYHGQHPLRERARKLSQGILIIRFEMPYNIWCDGCNSHVAMGVRYNAEKSKIGMYYTTPIYKFRMKCHLCDNHYEIKTDPANHDYVITSGARRKEQRWDPHENEQIVPEDRATQKKLALDSMYKLEHGTTDQSRGKAAAPAIAEIVEHQAAHKDDFLLNQLARKRFRDAKKVSADAVLRDDEIKKKFSLNIDLVSESKDDARIAELLQYSAVETYDERQKAKRQSIESRPLFSTSQPVDVASSSSSSSSGASTSDRRKLNSLNRIRQISEADRARQRSEAFIANPSVSTGRVLLTNSIKKSQKLFGIALKPAKRKLESNELGVKHKKSVKTETAAAAAAASDTTSVPSSEEKERLQISAQTTDCDKSECGDSKVAVGDSDVSKKLGAGDQGLRGDTFSIDSDSVNVTTPLPSAKTDQTQNTALHALISNYDSSSSTSDS